MAGALNGLCHAALEFQAGAGQAAGQQAALVVDKLEQKVCVFVVNVFDTGALEAAVLFAYFFFAACWAKTGRCHG